MTETATLDQPAPDLPIHPSEVLLHLILNILSPMFLGVSGGDINLARITAFATIDDYAGRTHADLIAIAQIIAFGLAAMASLSASLEDGISPSMALRLRGNANALDRSAENNRRALQKARPADPATQQPQTAQAPASTPLTQEELDVIAEVAKTQKRVEELCRGKPWAIASQPVPAADRSVQTQQAQPVRDASMAGMTPSFITELAGLAPAERQQTSNRAALLNGCAHELLSGNVPAELDPTIRAELNLLQAASAAPAAR
jgi:hypothetical protein